MLTFMFSPRSRSAVEVFTFRPGSGVKRLPSFFSCRVKMWMMERTRMLRFWTAASSTTRGRSRSRPKNCPLASEDVVDDGDDDDVDAAFSPRSRGASRSFHVEVLDEELNERFSPRSRGRNSR